MDVAHCTGRTVVTVSVVVGVLVGADADVAMIVVATVVVGVVVAGKAVVIQHTNTYIHT